MLFDTLESRRLMSASVANGVLTITGTTGNDTILVRQQDAQTIRLEDNGVVSQFADSAVNSIVINGLGGNDSLRARNFTSGGTTLRLLEPVTINGGVGNDTIEGADGNDVLIGEAGNDSISGGAGNDLLDGGINADTLFGFTGNDTLNGGLGTDVLTGAQGIDTADYSARIENLSLRIGAGFASGAVGELDNIEADVENVLGGSGNDRIEGNGLDNILTGNAGNDFIFGSAGIDVLNGNAGDDQLIGGSGDDDMFGGLGNDQLFGTSGADELSGESGNDILVGGSGTDAFNGGSGSDFIDATDGISERVNGGTGTDTVLVDSAVGSFVGDLLFNNENVLFA